MKPLSATGVDKTLKDMRLLKGDRYDYIKVIVFWSLIEAWIDLNTNNKYGNRSADKLNWIRREENDLVLFFASNMSTSDLKQIVNAAKVLNLKVDSIKPDDKRRHKILPSKDIKDIVSLLYVARCNVAHGKWRFDWSNNNSDEQGFVTCISRVFDKLLGHSHISGVI